VSDLGEFLRNRRAATRPEDFGMPADAARRRVPGLRREEVALLAGISVDYYVRLEQGRTRNVSDEVLDAVADVLRLDRPERVHLRNLARPAPRGRRPVPEQRVRPGMRRLLECVSDIPAFVLGRRMDVLAWNDLARLVAGDFEALPPRERNMARIVFLLDGHERYPEFGEVAKEVVGNLRAYAGRRPDDPELARLIGELSLSSPEFRRLWAGHTVREKTHGSKLIRHPAVGEFTVRYETLRLPDDPEQLLVTYTVAAGSTSETAFRLLAGWSARSPDPGPGADRAADRARGPAGR
jgi:transcriptional regulator with XRE-family HTH domain